MRRLVLTTTLALVLFAMVTANGKSTSNDDNDGSNKDGDDDVTSDDSYNCSDTGFAQWGKKHKKDSNNADDDDKKLRKQKWHSSCNKVKEHNDKFRRGEVSYKLALNREADRTKEELMARRGYRPQSEAVPSRRKRRAVIGTTYKFDKRFGLKTSVFWNGTNLVGPVLEQSQCGSCWAFAGIGALEGAYAKKYGKFVKASEQNIIDCATDAYGSSGCAGGGVGSVWQYTMANGVDSFASYPLVWYNWMPPTPDPCKYNPLNKVITATNYQYVEKNETTLAQALDRYGPIAVCIAALWPDFDYYSSGIYDNPQCNSENINHCVLLVGYGTYNKTNVWWLKNSWGTWWGMQGYFYMRRGVNMCWIREVAQFATVK